METMRLRAALYAGGDNAAALARSLAALRAWAAEHAGWEVVAEHGDELAAGEREGFERLIADIEAHRLDLVLCNSLREFLPFGQIATVRYLVGLGRCGVQFGSRTEPYLSTSGEEGKPFARALRALQAQERLRFSTHPRHQAAEARRDGRTLGRSRLPRETRVAIARLRREGRSIAATAKALGVAPGTVAKYQDWPVDDLLELLPDRAIRALFGGRRRD